MWLPEPGDDPPVPPGARLIRGSADLPGAHLLDLVATMDRLRVECPWDAQQTHQSLAPHLLEEPFEALEALESGDEQALREELGDVLLQVMFHARIAAERDDGTGYTIDDVADGIVAKLVRRHPHVFGDVTRLGGRGGQPQLGQIKRQEKADRAGRAGVAAAGEYGRVGAGRRAVRPAGAGAGRAAAAAGGAGRGAGGAGPAGPASRRRGPGYRPGAVPAGGQGAGAGLDPEMELRAAARRYRDLVRAWERSGPSAGR